VLRSEQLVALRLGQRVVHRCAFLEVVFGGCFCGVTCAHAVLPSEKAMALRLGQRVVAVVLLC
jgi:hypothetical protein